MATFHVCFFTCLSDKTRHFRTLWALEIVRWSFFCVCLYSIVALPRKTDIFRLAPFSLGTGQILPFYFCRLVCCPCYRGALVVRDTVTACQPVLTVNIDTEAAFSLYASRLWNSLRNTLCFWSALTLLFLFCFKMWYTVLYYTLEPTWPFFLAIISFYKSANMVRLFAWLQCVSASCNIYAEWSCIVMK